MASGCGVNWASGTNDTLMAVDVSLVDCVTCPPVPPSVRRDVIGHVTRLTRRMWLVSYRWSSSVGPSVVSGWP